MNLLPSIHGPQWRAWLLLLTLAVLTLATLEFVFRSERGESLGLDLYGILD
jgi:hypothetical protein